MSVATLATDIGSLPPRLRESVAQTAVLLDECPTNIERKHQLLLLLVRLAYAEGAAECARQIIPTKEPL